MYGYKEIDKNLILQSVTHHLIRKQETFPFPAASADFDIWG